jgi:hypothetical protein
MKVLEDERSRLLGELSALREEVEMAREAVKIVKRNDGYWLDLHSEPSGRLCSIHLDVHSPLVLRVLDEFAALSRPESEQPAKEASDGK